MYSLSRVFDDDSCQRSETSRRRKDLHFTPIQRSFQEDSQERTPDLEKDITNYEKLFCWKAASISSNLVATYS